MTDDIRGDEVTKTIKGYNSKYKDDADKMLGALNEVSPSFCLAKWFNVSVHIPTGQTQSCYHPRLHKIPLSEIEADPSALHNTNFKKSQRKQMLAGIRPKECEFCWNIEDSSNEISDRAYRSQDVYEPSIIEEAQALGFTGNAVPRYLEVNFNQACNFKCTYCSPHLSTAWAKDIKTNGPYELNGHKHNDMTWMKDQGLIPDNGPNNPYLKAFWEWFPVIYPELQTFRMTGGEPLMDKSTFKIFDYVKANPNPKLQLKITSNCCPPGNQWSKFMTSLKEITDADAIDHFMLFCSVDSWGDQAEYIRDGLDFDLLYNNITDYLKNSDKHSITFIVTFNNLSIPGWMEYVRNILKMRQEFNTDRQLIWFDTPMLTSPEWMSAQMLTKEQLEPLLESIEFMKEHAEDDTCRFKGFKDFEVSRVQRLYDWAIQDMPNRDRAVQNFKLFFDQYDKRTGRNFNDTFDGFSIT